MINDKLSIDAVKDKSKARKLGRDAQIIASVFNFGAFLKSQRKKAGLTQKAAAIKLQMMGYTISEKVISEIEQNRIQRSMGLYALFAHIYHFEIGKLFDDFYNKVVAYYTTDINKQSE